MSSAPTANVIPKPQETSTVAAILSYLVPGLGQIYQGRFGKGFLFMISLLGMFTLGQAMGNWQNVYVPPVEGAGNHPGQLRNTPSSLLTRPLALPRAVLDRRLRVAGVVSVFSTAAAEPRVLGKLPAHAR
jgi:hypothetical protein